PEFQGEGNNITAGLLPVVRTIPPDLQVTTVTAAGPAGSQPGHVQLGQSFSVTYAVQNTGAGNVPDRQFDWADLVYLSRDPVLSASDVYLGNVRHNGGLNAGASYG